MATELLFINILLIDLLFIYLASRLGKLYLAVTLVMNIILAVIFAGKIIELFSTAVGLSALFYAPIFVITNIVHERYGKNEAKRSVHIGLFSLVVLLVLLYLGANIPGSNETAETSHMLNALFDISTRVVFGTILTYYIAQWLNICLYRKIGEVTKRKLLWLRHNAASVIALGVDSIVFYPIAFYGIIPIETLLIVILTGWGIKSFVSVVATPITYLLKKK